MDPSLEAKNSQASTKPSFFSIADGITYALSVSGELLEFPNVADEPMSWIMGSEVKENILFNDE